MNMKNRSGLQTPHLGYRQAYLLSQALPDALMGIPPERDHLVDFQGPGPTGSPWASLQGAVLHLGQEVLGKRAAYIVAVTILKKIKEAGARVRWQSAGSPKPLSV